jgi:predicted ATPase
LFAQFDNAVHFVDLAQISDPHLVAGEIAASVGLIQYSGGLTPGLVAFLREKRLLLLVDNCEHVIGEAASVIERLIQEAPLVYVLATSREPLQVEGERVQRLFPLECPPANETPTAAEALEYPAVRHFVERASAATENFALDDSNAPLVADICRQLDGVALALELAAGGVEAYGLQGTAALLRSQFTLPLRGKRTASPRQQTLRATLDWSYTLLSDFERIAIRRLAVFVGPFTIDAAESVVVTNEAKADFFVEALAELVSKSLVIAESESRPAKYRLLATTRTYALERLSDVGEVDAIARRHAIYFQRLLENADHDAAMLDQAGWLEKYGGLLGDVRAALQWSFSVRGDAGIGVGLAGFAVKYLLEMSLMSESHQWCERAINALDVATRGTRAEMQLQECFGLATMVFRGNQEEVRIAFERGLEIATSLEDVDHMMRNLGQLTLYYVRIGDFRSGLAAAERGRATAWKDKQSSSEAMADWMLGVWHNLAGDQSEAIAFCRAVVARPLQSRRIYAVRYGVLDRAYAIGALARALWLSGHADQAIAIVDEYVQEASLADHPLVYCTALLDTVSVSVWSGNLAMAREAIDQLIRRATQHSLGPYRAVGEGWRAELEVRNGNLETGITLLRECLGAMSVDRQQVLNVAFSCYLAEALASRGDFGPALALIEDVLAHAEIDRRSYRLPEILRVKGSILAAAPDGDAQAALTCYQRSRALARERSTLAWELLTTMSIARLWIRQGRSVEARTELEAVYTRFSEGFGSADLVAARALLDTLNRAQGDGEKPGAARLRKAVRAVVNEG